METQNDSHDENAYAAPSSPPVLTKKKRSFRLVELAVVIAIIFILVAMLVPMVGRGGSREASHRVQCLNIMRQIALAAYNYESANGHFPPAYIADENGKPMHSWRVLLLPYLEEQDLYDSYSMDEPWDGPNNSKLHDEIVSLYRCPSSSSDESCTDYVLITGEGTGFENDQTINLRDITDGSSNTIMVTEIAGSDIHWMKPQDISLGQFLGLEKSATAPNHSDTKNVALFDGSTHSLPIDADAEELKKLVMIADGEVVSVLDF